MGARIGVIAFIVCALVGSAAADTGGRMGGGNWSSSSSSSHSSSSSSWGSSRSSSSSWSSSGSSRSSSSSSWSSSRRDSSSTYHYSSGTTGGYYGGEGPPSSGSSVFVVIIVIGGLVLLAVLAIAKLRPAPVYYPSDAFAGGGAFPTGGVDVGVLRIAIDGRARKFVQSELARIASTADTASEAGRATMLREVTLLLRRLRDAWVYGGAVNEPMRDLAGAKQAFDRHVDDARARFRTETIANVQGTLARTAADGYTPRSAEGEGLILVSIIVAANTELFTVTEIGSGEQLRKALEAASYRSPSDLVAIEIIWQPSEDADRLSSIELEAKYPHPELIRIRGALVGKVFCAYCSGPFPAELVSCPHCGAPASGAGGEPAQRAA